MLRLRSDDRAFLGLLRKWLKAGILETDGRVIHPDTGVPTAEASALGCLTNQRAVHLKRLLLAVGEADGGMSPDKETDHEYHA